MNRADVLSRAVPLVNADVAKSASITQLSAYLSLCMLTAAYGAMLGPVWCRWWAICGTFGLASSFGLDVLRRVRARRADMAERRQFALSAERKLNEMMDDLESRGAIHDALHRLQSGAVDPASQSSDGQAELRLPLNKPATIRRLFPSSRAPGYRLGEPRAGLLQNISRHGFGLAHNQRVERGIILLECDLDDGEPLQFVADVLWCELQAGGRYCSGGRLLEVMSPRDSRPEDDPGCGRRTTGPQP